MKISELIDQLKMYNPDCEVGLVDLSDDSEPGKVLTEKDIHVSKEKLFICHSGDKVDVSEERLISFGNYLLSEERMIGINPLNKDHVTDADLQNWKNAMEKDKAENKEN